jgi:hypothetical protein
MENQKKDSCCGSSSCCSPKKMFIKIIILLVVFALGFWIANNKSNAPVTSVSTQSK